MSRDEYEEESYHSPDSYEIQDFIETHPGFRNPHISSRRESSTQEEAKGSIEDLCKQLKLFRKGIISNPIDPFPVNSRTRGEGEESCGGECPSETNIWNWKEIGRQFRETIHLSQVREERKDQEELI